MNTQERHTPKEGNSYTIPAAIVIAGAIIALALVYTNNGTQTVKEGPVAEKASAAVINLDPVSAEDHVLGNPNAGVVIVEYSDTECPFCKNFHTTMHRLIDLYGKEGEVAWVYRHFPIETLHSKASREAQATECATELAGDTGFWRYIDRLFSVTPSNNKLEDSELPNIAEDIGLDREAFLLCLDNGKYKDKVENGVASAQKAGGRGTPFSVITLQEKLSGDAQDFINSATSQFPPRTVLVSDDKKRIAISGALPFEFMKLLLDSIVGSK